MSEIATLLQMDFMHSVKKRVDAVHDEIKPSFEARDLSKLIFREQLDSKNVAAMHAHLHVIHEQLNGFYDSKFLKDEAIILEFSKSITLFDRVTKFLKIDGGVYGDNSIASQNFYLDAVGSYKRGVPNLYQGDMDFSCIPLKLRMAIEIYFKNMIGYVSSEQEFLTGKRKGKVSPYPLSISDLLKFFDNKKYNKYILSPVDIGLVMDINYWSNNLMHTGVISFAWQNLFAIDCLKPLFHTQHDDGFIHLNGFNYLSPSYDQSELVRDLNNFLSDRFKNVRIHVFEFNEKPMEGAFYYPRNITNKSK